MKGGRNGEEVDMVRDCSTGERVEMKQCNYLCAFNFFVFVILHSMIICCCVPAMMS